MKRLFILFLIAFLTIPVKAAEPHIPVPPAEAQEMMPENTDHFGVGFHQLIQNVLRKLRPDLLEAAKVSLSMIAAVMIVSVLKTFSGPIQRIADLAGSAAVAAGLFMTSNSLIRLGAETVMEISEYGKLLLPVLTGALAAQGGVTKSSAIFAGTAGFMALLGSLISRILIPMTYLFLIFSLGSSSLGEESLKKVQKLLQNVISWSLKTIITVFTSYIGLTGIVTGTADAAALKAAKAAVSTVVPVVGNILSGASETMLLSAAMVKNAAGIYGILAVLAIFLGPFLKILAHYWVLKVTSAVCSVFGTGPVSALVEDFSAAMGFLLAMTGTTCLMMLIGTVCFMKGVG